MYTEWKPGLENHGRTESALLTEDPNSAEAIARAMTPKKFPSHDRLSYKSGVSKPNGVWFDMQIGSQKCS